MGSKVSKAKRSTFKITKAFLISRISQDAVPTPPRNTVSVPLQDFVPLIPQFTIPIIPYDIISEIVDHLVSNSGLRSLRACALVSKSWVQPCRRRLFHTVVFTPARAREWLKMFPVREESPAYHVRDLCLEIGGDVRDGIPEEFLECIEWFTDVDRMTLSGYKCAPPGYGGFPSLPKPSFQKLPMSVTSLTINTDAVALVQLRDIMAQLPNLDDLVVSGFPAEVDRRKFPGIGTVLKGRFGGQLMLRNAGEDIVDMLLEIPSGLRFTELEIHFMHDYLPSAVRLAAACGETLVKLSYTARSYLTIHQDTAERSFDFSKFPNVQEVTFGIIAYLAEGGMPWIPMALSTLRPTTSPSLSAIRLDFRSTMTPPREPAITDMRNDLRRIADEVARIKREFKGVVNFTVVLDSRFEAMLDPLNILRRHVH